MINLVINIQTKSNQQISAKKRKLTESLFITKQQEFEEETKTAMKKLNSKSARKIKHLLEKKESTEIALKNLSARNAEFRQMVTTTEQNHRKVVAKILEEWDVLDKNSSRQKKESDALKRDVENIKLQIVSKVQELENVFKKIKAKETKQQDPISKILGILAGSIAA